MSLSEGLLDEAWGRVEKYQTALRDLVEEIDGADSSSMEALDSAILDRARALLEPARPAAALDPQPCRFHRNPIGADDPVRFYDSRDGDPGDDVCLTCHRPRRAHDRTPPCHAHDQPPRRK